MISISSLSIQVSKRFVRAPHSYYMINDWLLRCDMSRTKMASSHPISRVAPERVRNSRGLKRLNVIQDDQDSRPWLREREPNTHNRRPSRRPGHFCPGLGDVSSLCFESRYLGGAKQYRSKFASRSSTLTGAIPRVLQL